MVCFSTVGFALAVIVVLEFDSACWAVCDAHLLGSCEYLFSELFVFSGACSAHRCSSSFLVLFFLFCVGVRWWRVAASARRAPPPSNTTLYSLSSSSRFSFFSLFLFCLWGGVCCVVRAQPSEHARNATHTLWFGLSARCSVCIPSHSIVASTIHCSLLTTTTLTIEHQLRYNTCFLIRHCLDMLDSV